MAEVWLPDLPGHGRSRVAERPLPDLPTLLSRTLRWLAALDPAPIAVGGHSLGAWLVREGIAGGQLSTKAAVLLCPPTPVATPSAPTRRGRSLRITGARRRGALRLRADLVEWIEEETGERPSREFEAELVRASLLAPELYDPLLAQLRRRLIEPLRVCDVPAALVLLGSCDHIAVPADAQPLLDATPGAELVVLDGAGHFPFAQRAEPVSECVERFLTQQGLLDGER